MISIKRYFAKKRKRIKRKILKWLSIYYSNPKRMKKLDDHSNYPPECKKSVIEQYDGIEDEDMKAIFYNIFEDIISERKKAE